MHFVSVCNSEEVKEMGKKGGEGNAGNLFIFLFFVGEGDYFLQNFLMQLLFQSNVLLTSMACKMFLYSLYIAFTFSLQTLCVGVVVRLKKTKQNPTIKRSFFTLSLSSFSTFNSVVPVIAGSCFSKIAQITHHSSSLKCCKNRKGVSLRGEGISSSGKNSVDFCQ